MLARGGNWCKRALLAEMGLPPENIDRPVFGIVSRFVDQKGFDLIAQIAGELAGLDIAMTVLGSGETRYEAMFRQLASAFPDKFGVRITDIISPSERVARLR